MKTQNKKDSGVLRTNSTFQFESVRISVPSRAKYLPSIGMRIWLYPGGLLEARLRAPKKKHNAKYIGCIVGENQVFAI